MARIGDGTGMDKEYKGPFDGGTHYDGDTANDVPGNLDRGFDSPGAEHDGVQRTSYPHGNKSGGMDPARGPKSET